MKSNSLIFLVTTIILASGCQVAGDPNIKHQKLSVDEISNSNQCRLEVNPSAHWLDNFEAANAMMAKVMPQQLDSVSEPLNPQDFVDRTLLIVNMGSQPTAGYSLSLLETSLQVDGDLATVTVSWEVPDDSSIQAQLLTQPCLALAVQQGDYSNIELVDQNQNRLFILPTR